jgi:hypothetical protein
MWEWHMDRDNDDLHIFLAAEMASPFVPLLRVYIEGCDDIRTEDLSAAVHPYQVFHRGESLALTRQVKFSSEESFCAECNRIAALIGTICMGHWNLTCLYNGSREGTECYQIELSSPPPS